MYNIFNKNISKNTNINQQNNNRNYDNNFYGKLNKKN